MNDMIKYGLIAVGGYLLYEYFIGSSTTSTTATNTGATTTGTTSSPQANPNSSLQSATLAAVVAAMTASKVDNPYGFNVVDVYNSYYQGVRGVAGPAPETLGLPNYVTGAKYDITTWWNAMTSKGFSGMGLIAHHINPYITAMQQGSEFGANLVPTGMEKYIKVL